MSSAQVPEGYKQTEIGVIPEDWKVISIQTALDEKYIEDQMDGNHGELYPRSHEFVSYGIPYIGANDFWNGRVSLKNCKFLSEFRAGKFKKGIARSGDVLFAHNATVGPVALLNYDGDFIILSTTATYFRCNQKKLNNLYFRFILESQYFIKQYSSVMNQSTRYQVPITTQRKFSIAIPKPVEQQTIAEALSDVDTLITSLDKLIAKQRQLKTAAMQQLLTGKMRLPGFGEGKGYKQTEVGVIPEDWDVKCLGEIGQSLIGLTYRPEDTRDYGTLVLRSSNVQNDRLAYENNVYVDSSLPLPSRVIVEAGDILICVRNGSKQLIGKCALIDAEAAGSAFGAFMSVFRTKIYGFIFYQFQSDIIQTQINEIMGATINQITNKDMAAFQIPLPPSHEEQHAIATVLSDMDTTIAALEKRRAKTQAIKQGMMQELLTGRTRLV